MDISKKRSSVHQWVKISLLLLLALALFIACPNPSKESTIKARWGEARWGESYWNE
jgi:hypothetical protein